MTTHLSLKRLDLLGFVGFSSSFDRFLILVRRSLFLSLFVSLIGLAGLFTSPAIAAPTVTATLPLTAAQRADAAESDRMVAIIACLPKQLSKPSLKRALSEMGNDQIERALNLKANPKLSEAEIELENCLSRRGF